MKTRHFEIYKFQLQVFYGRHLMIYFGFGFWTVFIVNDVQNPKLLRLYVVRLISQGVFYANLAFLRYLIMLVSSKIEFRKNKTANI